MPTLRDRDTAHNHCLPLVRGNSNAAAILQMINASLNSTQAARGRGRRPQADSEQYFHGVGKPGEPALTRSRRGESYEYHNYFRHRRKG